MSGGFGVPLIDFAPLGQAISGLSQIGQRDEAIRLQEEQLRLALAAQGQAPAGQAQTPLAALGTPAATPNLPSFAQAGSGGMGDYLNTIRAKESGGNDLAKNPNSTATGRYQFTTGTWNALARQHPELGLTPNGRTDPAQQEKAIRVFTDQNAKALTAAGIPINPQNLYGAHFLGAGGAKQFIPGAINNPDAPAASLVGPGVASANRSVFYNKDGSPKTAGQVYAWMGGQRGGGGQTAPASAPTAPVQVASAQADVPAPGAQPIGFNVPGQGGGDFVPGTEASPALAQPRGAAAPAAAGGLSPAASQRLSPAQADNLRAMLRNPLTQGHAAKIIEGLNEPDEFSFQVVGDQLVRTSKSGRAEVVPNITKPVQYQTFKGSDGNDYVFNPQTGQTTRAIEGREKQFTDLVSPDERAAAGVDPAYRGPVQRGPNGELKFPGKAQTEVNIGAENAGAKATATKSAEAVVSRFDAIGKVGESARSDIPLIGEIRELGGAIGTGGIAALQAKLGEYGIKTEGSGKIEAYNALLDRLTPAQRIEGAGATSDFDARMFKGSLPRLINTPEGNALVADTLEAVAKDRVARGEIANAVLLGEQQGGISAQEGFKRLKALPSIQTGFVARMKELRDGGRLGAEPAASGAGRATPETLMKQAQDAIARGAPRDQVIERLRSKGFSVEGL